MRQVEEPGAGGTGTPPVSEALPRDDVPGPRGPSPIEWQLLGLMGVPASARQHALVQAADPAEGLAEALMRSGHLDEKDWWFALAHRLQATPLDSVTLPPAPAGEPIPPAEVERRLNTLWEPGPDQPRLVIAPRGRAIDRAAAFLGRDPGLRGRVAVASPRAMRAALRDRHALSLARAAIGGLRLGRPDLSASTPPGLAVLCLSGLAIAVVPLALAAGWLLPVLPFLACFLALGLLRLVAGLDARREPEPPPLTGADLPTYAVLVPLLREEAVVAPLVEGLLRLDYPLDRLDIRLVVEEDDTATRRACYRAVQGTPIDVVVVPPSRPRTKPKALSYALQLVDAELVTIFDAEDVPAPDQLRRAAAAFAVAGPNLVCVQAILDIDHAPGHRTWISRQFALEYRILFRGILPWLGRHGGWFPIGGTSNHFRLRALREAGGWDPYNVTEDADIATRLARLGGRFATIASATYEEAPLTFPVWLAQRSRWLKGWMQTWFVHMRSPARLLAELGPGRFLIFQTLIAGQIASAFLFPLGLAALAVRGAANATGILADGDDDLVRALTLATFSAAWLGALVVALRTRDRAPIGEVLADVATLPAYWALLALAALRAAIDLARHPFRWNKTPHGRARRDRS